MTEIELSEEVEDKIESLQDEIDIQAAVSDESLGDYTVKLDDRVTKEQVVEISVSMLELILEKDREMEAESILEELDGEMAATLESRDIKQDL